MTIYVDNSNVVSLTGLTDEITGESINDATVALTAILDRNGSPVPDTESLSMDYVAASSGVYRVVLPDTIDLVAGRRYTAVIEANAGAGRIGLWRVPFTAKQRRDS